MKERVFVTKGYYGEVLEEVVVEAASQEELDARVRATAAALSEKFRTQGGVVNSVTEQ